MRRFANSALAFPAGGRCARRRRMRIGLCRILIFVLASCGAAAAQDIGTLNPKPLPPIANPNDPNTPAKDLFGRKSKPAPLQARAIGYYTGGCLAGGVMLPINGETWQVMRLSRNRNWGHPNLVRFLERFAAKTPAIGWNLPRTWRRWVSTLTPPQRYSAWPLAVK